MAFMVAFPGESYEGPPPETGGELETRLRSHVQALATEIGPRGVTNPGSLDASAKYIRRTLESQGYEVVSESFEVEGAAVENLYVTIDGRTAELVVLGAHYDTHPGSPGADDNASGVAALLALANALRGAKLHRSIRLVAFVNEEYPFARTDLMGSVVHARAARARGDRIYAMVSLESIGNYSDAPGSQHTPPLFRPFYPDSGNFLVFMGNLGARPDVTRALTAFRAHGEIPSEGLAAPTWLVGTHRSDHWAFWQEGYPGVMVTDTAPYRWPDYHEPTDTADTLEYDHLATAVRGIHAMTLRLATEH
jgi:Zn-dependent M28 family amino/carboxypeptidase